MKKKILICLGAIAFLSSTGEQGFAQDAVPDHSLSEFKLGTHVSGPEVDLANIEGKVVTIEYWGTH